MRLTPFRFWLQIDCGDGCVVIKSVNGLFIAPKGQVSVNIDCYFDALTGLYTPMSEASHSRRVRLLPLSLP